MFGKLLSAIKCIFSSVPHDDSYYPEYRIQSNEITGKYRVIKHMYGYTDIECPSYPLGHYPQGYYRPLPGYFDSMTREEAEVVLQKQVEADMEFEEKSKIDSAWR